MRQLPPALAKIAHEKLNETPERIEQDIYILRTWIKQKRYIKINTSKEVLIMFLRRSNYSLERTKELIEKYVGSFTLLSDILSNRVVNYRVLEINAQGVHYYPEHPKSDDLNAVVISRPAAIDYSRHSSRDIFRYYSMTCEIIAMENDYAAVAGVSILLDLKDFSPLSIHYAEADLNLRCRYWLFECCPLRVNHIYVLNVNKDLLLKLQIFTALSKLFSKFVPVTFIKSQSDLFKYFTKSCLPEEYGGTNGHIVECIRYMDDMLKHYAKYFEEQAVYGTYEQYRAGACKTIEVSFGVDGTYRKLHVE